MTLKERYQQRLDQAYQSAPFTLVRVIDTKDEKEHGIIKMCAACGNRRIRYLCECTDKLGKRWQMGRDCWTELYNRQFEEAKKT